MSIDKINIETIKNLIDLMEERELQSLELACEEQSVKLTRYFEAPAFPTIVQSSAAVPQSNPSHTSGTPELSKVLSEKVEKSPMVGVFYSAPSPNEPPFVSAGQKVKAGDTLGIIEAMKIMNPLEATQSGIIKEVLVNNGDVVEFGQAIVSYES